MPIFINNEQKEHSIDCVLLENQGKSILRVLGCENQELSVLLADDRKIRTLNKQYRGQDRATDVLSFSQNDEEEESKPSYHLMGDVVISAVTAKRQAAEHGLTLEEEIVLLLIHGILHLLGFDHERSNEEACHMKQKTRELFDWIFPNKKPEGSCSLYSD
ncbi:MAG: rRNA maturation RNase YbeY [Nitrospina sp.]|jgi:rRNA maturation RNase YbeY|nr:rRNA maturation RNase YbeY [Nitrospina sp.]